MISWQSELEKIFNTSWPNKDPFRKVSSEGIVLYGAGSMGYMVLDLLKTINVTPCYIVDKTNTGVLNGVKIIKPEQIPPADLKKMTFIICIASIPVQPIFDFLKNLGCVDVRHFYDYSEIALKTQMTNGWAAPNPDFDQKEGIKSVCKALEHDACSLAHYLQFLWWRLRRKEVLYPKYPVLSDKKYFNCPSCPALSENECFLDGGAHFGSTINMFVEANKSKFDCIWAFEPDISNQRVLKESIKKNIAEKTTIYNEAVSDKSCELNFQDGLGYASKIDENGNKKVKTVALDDLMELSPSIIKLHIEGDELKALNGAKNLIKKYKPILMVLADHSPDGLYKIADFLIKQDNYKLFFNLHDYCGNTAVFYAYSKEHCNIL